MSANSLLQAEKDIIKFLNDNQTTYFLVSRIFKTSKSDIFLGYKKSNEKQSNYDKSDNVALKVININSQLQLENVQREQKILEILHDIPHIIKYNSFIEINKDDKHFILLPMHYFRGHDFFSCIFDKRNSLNKSILHRFTFQALQILKILKSFNIVHGNITLENFLVDSEDPLEIILTGFSNAKILVDNKKATGYNGSIIFKAPEIFSNQAYDYASDIWSLGVSIYLAQFKEYPFGIESDDNEETVFEKIQKNPLEKLNGSVSNDLWDFIQKALVINPEERIKVEDALELDWFKYLDTLLEY